MVILYFKEEQEEKKSEGRNRSNNAVVPNKTYSIENTHTQSHAKCPWPYGFTRLVSRTMLTEFMQQKCA